MTGSFPSPEGHDPQSASPEGHDPEDQKRAGRATEGDPQGAEGKKRAKNVPALRVTIPKDRHTKGHKKALRVTGQPRAAEGSRGQPKGKGSL